MYCKNCGNMIPEGASNCPQCGEAADSSVFNVSDKDTAGSGHSSFNVDGSWKRTVDYNNPGHFNFVAGGSGSGYDSTPSGGQYPGMKLKEDRSIWMYILLTIVTCGIYPLFFVYKLVEDINIALDGDGEETPGLVKYILLSIITCGLYRLFWQYQLGNRLAKNGPRYGINFQENGTTVLMWILFGVFLCGLGPIFAWHILIKNTNVICQAYNRSHGC